jgi:hypothetical protein
MKTIRLLLLSALITCAAVATTKAQCPPEEDCDWPGDDPGGYTDCVEVSCDAEYIQSQGWNPNGTVWMRVCKKCDLLCTTENGVPMTLSNIMRCYDINRQPWYGANVDPTKDIESLAFTDLIAVMEDLTRRAQATTRI